MKTFKLDWLVLPILGMLLVVVVWHGLAGKKEVVRDAQGEIVSEKRVGLIPALPNVVETWQASRIYIVEPFAKRGELDQGILRFTWLSLVLVAKGYLIALLAGTPLGFMLGQIGRAHV